jgi:spore photoproduct lyase
MPVTRRVLERLGISVPVTVVDDTRDPIMAQAGRAGRALVLCDFHGEAIKPCPGTPRYLCCGYQILNFGQGCPFECSYCILQNYFEHRHLVVQANADALLAAAAERLRSEPGRFFRLGTGEFADSLALEPLTGWAERLVAFASEQPNAVLELKTKSDRIHGLLGLDHGGRTVCAWSLNAADVAAEEEYGVAPLEARLAAATRCAQAGYRLAFHFDPIFHYDGWQEGYRRMIERLFAAVPAESIAWISLGCFRFTPGLERVIAERFPRNRRIYGEFVRGEDGKMRYPQPLRVAVYRRMAEWIAQAGGGKVLVYLCMENAAVWRAALGRAPRDNEELGDWLDVACRR